MDDRVLLSLGSFDAHTAQSHRGTGTPWEVPVPRKVIVSGRPTQFASRQVAAPWRKVMMKNKARMSLKKRGTFA